MKNFLKNLTSCVVFGTIIYIAGMTTMEWFFLNGGVDIETQEDGKKRLIINP